jgi:parvulin-like peptidyl-prolyl isomerase
MKKTVITLAGIIIFLLACTKQESPPEPGVVALVNGEKLTEKQVQEYLDQYQQGMQMFLKGKLPDQQSGDLRKQVIEQTLNFMVVSQEAKKRNLTISDEEIDRYFQEMKKAPHYQEILKIRKLDEAGLREKLRDEMLIMKYMQTQVKQEVNITDQEIQAFYQEHKEEFKQPSKIRARHILFKVGAKAPAAKAAQTRQQLEGIFRRIKEGENFAALAKKHSQDPHTAKKGGDLGYFKKGDLLPEFDQTAFRMKKGQVCPPLRTQLGFHLIQVTDVKEPQIQPLADVSPQIRQLLMIKKNNEQLEKVVMDLRKKSDITIYEK